VPLAYDDEATDGEASEDARPLGGETIPAGVEPSLATVASAGDAGGTAPEGGDSAPEGDGGPHLAADVPGGEAHHGLRTEHGVLTGDGCLPLGSATQPPPATRKRKAARPAPVGDVETLWEAWRAHGSVRGEPNDHRRRAMERVLGVYPLADVLEMLDAAHTGDGDKWRFLQGATSRSNAVYLKPENLLRPSTIAGRMEDAAEWVEAGRPRHQVEAARVEARAEAVARPALQRARDAWPIAVKLIGSHPSAIDKLVAGWPEANQRALRDGLAACGGLMALGRADKFALPELRRKFLAGVVAALGGTVTEAELMREVG